MGKELKKLLLLILVVAYAVIGYTTAFAVERVYILPATTNKKAPVNNVFQLKGSQDKFIILDSTDEGYFVLAQKNCVSRVYSANGTPVPFNPEDPNSIAYWLNNDYLNDTTLANRLPDIMIENLVERGYPTEGGGSLVPFPSAYEPKCKVVLLSQTEWSKYNAKFGYADDTSSSAWWLRSVRELTGTPLIAFTSTSNAGLTHEGKWTSSLGVRPAFYLSKDFFEKAAVDVANTGDSVMSIIRNSHDKATLSKLYNSSELYTLTEMDIAPELDKVTVVGRGIVGEKLVGSYTFKSLDGNVEDGTIIQWQRSKSISGDDWSDILGAEEIDYVPTTNDIGYYLRMKVCPMTGSMAGATKTSLALSCAIRPVSKPVASNVKVISDSDAKPGKILDVKYSFYDENRDICSGTDYVWESSEDKISSNKIGDSRYYKLESKDGGKYVRVGVVPKKKTNSAVKREEISGELVYSDWIYVENLPMASGVDVNTVSGAENGIEKLTAVFSMDKSDKYEVICQWQGADSENGEYSSFASGTTLNSIPDNTMWVRAKVYTKNGQNTGNAVYSKPIYIGRKNTVEAAGEFVLTKNLAAGKTYEIWLSSDTVSNCYAYSFMVEGSDIPEIVSDRYNINKTEKSGNTYVMGILTNDNYINEAYIKAGEITPERGTEITISEAVTATFGVSDKARVFIVEK